MSPPKLQGSFFHSLPPESSQSYDSPGALTAICGPRMVPIIATWREVKPYCEGSTEPQSVPESSSELGGSLVEGAVGQVAAAATVQVLGGGALCMSGKATVNIHQGVGVEHPWQVW